MRMNAQNISSGSRSICIAVAAFFGLQSVCSAGCIIYSNPNKYHVRQIACSYNKNITTIDKLELNVSLPEDWPDCKITNVAVKGNEPFLLHNTEGPGQIYRAIFKNGVPQKGQTVFVSVDYDAELWQVDINLPELVNKTYAYNTTDAEYRYYTTPNKELMPDDPNVKPVVDACKNKAGGNPVLYAKAVFDWVGEHIKYTAQPPGGNKVCFQERRGDCGTFAAVFVALCRNGNVPARFVAGCWAGGFDGWHCWAEFYVPEVGWIPIDHSRSGGFGHLSNNHLPLVKAGNMRFDVKPEQGGDKAGFVQFGYWFYWFAGGGEGASIQTEFAVESFPYDEIAQNVVDCKDLQAFYQDAQTHYKAKDFNKAIQIYQYLRLSKSIDEKDDVFIRYQLAKCYLQKNKKVLAFLELRPLLESSDCNTAGKSHELLKQIRKETIFLSDLNIKPIQQGWGSPRRNQSVGGNSLSIAGKEFKNGIGTHSESICMINTNGSVEKFSAMVGIDDEVEKGNGSVEFQVIGDGTTLWKSGIMRSGDPAKQAEIKTEKIKKLYLKVTDGADGGACDHADWADAQLTIDGIYPSIEIP